MVIINQDRDTAVSFRKTNSIKGEIIFNDGIFYGINLIINKRIVGTFDTLDELFTEINNILNCKYEFYIINGFEDYANCLNT